MSYLLVLSLLFIRVKPVEGFAVTTSDSTDLGSHCTDYAPPFQFVLAFSRHMKLQLNYCQFPVQENKGHTAVRMGLHIEERAASAKDLPLPCV